MHSIIKRNATISMMFIMVMCLLFILAHGEEQPTGQGTPSDDTVIEIIPASGSKLNPKLHITWTIPPSDEEKTSGVDMRIYYVSTSQHKPVIERCAAKVGPNGGSVLFRSPAISDDSIELTTQQTSAILTGTHYTMECDVYLFDINVKQLQFVSISIEHRYLDNVVSKSENLPIVNYAGIISQWLHERAIILQHRVELLKSPLPKPVKKGDELIFKIILNRLEGSPITNVHRHEYYVINAGKITCREFTMGATTRPMTHEVIDENNIYTVSLGADKNPVFVGPHYSTFICDIAEDVGTSYQFPFEITSPSLLKQPLVSVLDDSIYYCQVKDVHHRPFTRLEPCSRLSLESIQQQLEQCSQVEGCVGTCNLEQVCLRTETLSPSNGCADRKPFGEMNMECTKPEIIHGPCEFNPNHGPNCDIAPIITQLEITHPIKVGSYNPNVDDLPTIVEPIIDYYQFNEFGEIIGNTEIELRWKYSGRADNGATIYILTGMENPPHILLGLVDAVDEYAKIDLSETLGKLYRGYLPNARIRMAIGKVGGLMTTLPFQLAPACHPSAIGMSLCQNESVCEPHTGLCKCTRDFGGYFCEKNRCERLDCVQENVLSPTCVIDENNRISCGCKPGYWGGRCQIDDQCKGIMCMNGDLVMGDDGKCHCKCRGQWIGLSCSQCSLNCNSGKSSSRCEYCECPVGYTGDFCNCAVRFFRYDLILSTLPDFVQLPIREAYLLNTVEEQIERLRTQFQPLIEADLAKRMNSGKIHRLEMSKFEIVGNGQYPDKITLAFNLMLDDVCETVPIQDGKAWEEIIKSLDNLNNFLNPDLDNGGGGKDEESDGDGDNNGDGDGDGDDNDDEETNGEESFNDEEPKPNHGTIHQSHKLLMLYVALICLVGGLMNIIM